MTKAADTILRGAREALSYARADRVPAWAGLAQALGMIRESGLWPNTDPWDVLKVCADRVPIKAAWGGSGYLISGDLSSKVAARLEPRTEANPLGTGQDELVLHDPSGHPDAQWFRGIVVGLSALENLIRETRDPGPKRARKRPGPAAMVVGPATRRMVEAVEAGRFTVEELADMPPDALVAEFETKRTSAGKARAAAVSEIRARATLAEP